MSIEFKISKDFEGVKPKNFLKKRLDLPFYKIVRLIRDKRITINGKRINKEYVLKDGDVIKVWPKDVKVRVKSKDELKAKDLGLEVIYDCDDFVVFNKLPNIVVQGAQDKNISISYHLKWYKESLGDMSDFEYFHVHRLDKNTSGCLVVAKNLRALREFNKIFRSRGVVKKYLCLCYGVPKVKEGEIKVYLKRNPEGSAQKVSVTSSSDPLGKFSFSKYKVLEEFCVDGDEFSLIEVQILTGLTHQIRVHMSLVLNVPILGDDMYGNRSINEKYVLFLNRQFLHAFYLSFVYKGMEYKFTAKLTHDLLSFMKYLEKKSSF